MDLKTKLNNMAKPKNRKLSAINEEVEQLVEKSKFDMDLFNKHIGFRTKPEKASEEETEALQEDKPREKEMMDKLNRRFSRGSTMHRHMPTRLSQFVSRHKLLRNDKFLQKLETDSVDTEILDEELRSLEEDEPKTCRGKLVRVLDSNPVQIILCVLIFLDALVVLAEIIVDLQSIRVEQVEASNSLKLLVNFTLESHPNQLQHLWDRPDVQVETIISALEAYYNKGEAETSHHRKKRRAQFNPRMFLLQRHLPILDQICGLQDGFMKSVPEHSHQRDKTHTYALCDQSVNSRVLFESSTKACRKCNKYMHHINAELHTLTRNVKLLSSNLESCSDEIQRDAQRDFYLSSELEVDVPEIGLYDHLQTDGTPKHKRSVSDVYGGTENHTDSSGLIHGNETEEHHEEHHVHHSYAHTLHEVAHALHITSTVILGIFVVQIGLKIFGMGREFFKRKLEIFDGLIITASFALDIATLKPVGGVAGEGAIAFIMIFLLWRILRVINGIMVTAKQRQEFRIKLQKRARRRAEKKLEVLQEDRQIRQKEITALRELCRKHNITDLDINACRPKRIPIPKPSTQVGLSSVVNLSLGLSMSVAGATKTADGDVSKSNPNLKGPSGESSPIGVPLSDLRRNSANPRLTTMGKSTSSSATPIGSPSGSSVSSGTHGEGLPNGQTLNNNDIISETIPELEAEELNAPLLNAESENVANTEVTEEKVPKSKLVSLASTETVDSRLTDDALDTPTVENPPVKQENKNMQISDTNSNMQSTSNPESPTEDSDAHSSHSGLSSDAGLHFSALSRTSTAKSLEEAVPPAVKEESDLEDPKKESDTDKTGKDDERNCNPTNVAADINVNSEQDPDKEDAKGSKQLEGDDEKAKPATSSSKPNISTDANRTQDENSDNNDVLSLPNGRAEVIYLDETGKSAS